MMIDWHGIFAFDVPFLELFLRGTVMYLFLVLIMRFGINRTMGNIGVGDMLLVVLIADAAQNAMAGGHSSVGDGLFLVVTILFWAYVFDYVCFRFPKIGALIQPHRVRLIKNGQLLHRNMRRELITRDELMAQLRAHGVDDFRKVKEANLETNGEISVVRIEKGEI